MRDARARARDDVARPDARAERERSSVREPHRLVLVVERQDAHDRPEHLLLLEPRVRIAADEHRRLVEPAGQLDVRSPRARQRLARRVRAPARRDPRRGRAAAPDQRAEVGVGDRRRGRCAARAPARRARRRSARGARGRRRSARCRRTPGRSSRTSPRPRLPPPASRSASRSTSIGSLPPSSRITGRRSSAAAAAICRPVSAEPVKTTFAIPGACTSAAPVSPAPCTTRDEARRRAGLARNPRDPLAGERRQLGRLEHDGVASRNGARDLLSGIENGKFHGEMTATTPSGS